MLPLFDVINWMERDEDGFFASQRALNYILQFCCISPNQLTILLPIKRSVAEENIDPIWQDAPGRRTVFTRACRDRTTAKSVAEFIAELLKYPGINRVGQVRNEKLDSYLRG